MKFFDLRLHLASRSHFLVFGGRNQAGFRRGYSKASEAKTLQDRYTFMGSRSIFVFWSKSLACMVMEIWVPRELKNQMGSLGYPDLGNHTC